MVYVLIAASNMGAWLNVQADYTVLGLSVRLQTCINLLFYVLGQVYVDKV